MSQEPPPQEPPPPPHRHEPRLDPVLQERLRVQREQELAVAQRWRWFQYFVFLPGLLAALAISSVMALSDDMGTAVMGQVVASSILLGMWTGRKRIAAMFQ